MNLNTLVKRIKRTIGIYGIALPVEDVDQFIIDIIQDTTIPVFSLYCPWEQMIELDTTEMQRGIRGENCDLYILPEQLFTGRKVLSVKDVRYNENYLRNSYYPSYFQIDRVETFEGMMLSNVGKNILDGAVNSLTCHYEHPRKLYIYDALVSPKIIATLCYEHDQSLQSITPTSEESFFNLAILDVKMGLYQTIKHYDGIETAYGRIELKIEDWQSAEADRKDLIGGWDESFLLDGVNLIYK